MHLQQLSGAGGGGAAETTLVRRLLCVTADGHKRAAEVVTAATLYAHTQVSRKPRAPPGDSRQPRSFRIRWSRTAGVREECISRRGSGG